MFSSEYDAPQPPPIVYNSPDSVEQFYGYHETEYSSDVRLTRIVLGASRQSSGTWLPHWGLEHEPVTVFISGSRWTPEEALDAMRNEVDRFYAAQEEWDLEHHDDDADE